MGWTTCFYILLICKKATFFSEFAALDQQLDSLNCVLDAIEQKNDQVHDELKKLLQSSREAREEIQKQHGQCLPTEKQPSQK